MFNNVREECRKNVLKMHQRDCKEMLRVCARVLTRSTVGVFPDYECLVFLYS